ncbi:MAG: CopG family antitoxin [Chloroflexota bacterium]|nr:CopG family antitoxin [Chloroflexota bacterium]
MSKTNEALRRTESRIPVFKTIEEEAEFWDTHDSSAYDDEFETLTDVKFVRSKRKQPLTVRLDQDTVAALRRQAHRRGIGTSTLARMWITERVRDLEERNAAPKAS